LIKIHRVFRVQTLYEPLYPAMGDSLLKESCDLLVSRSLNTKMRTEQLNTVLNASASELIGRLCDKAANPTGGLLGELVHRFPIKRINTILKERKRVRSEEGKEMCNDIRTFGAIMSLTGAIGEDNSVFSKVYCNEIKRRSRCRSRKHAFGTAMKLVSTAASWCAPFGLGLIASVVTNFVLKQKQVHNDTNMYYQPGQMRVVNTIEERIGRHRLYDDDHGEYWTDREPYYIPGLANIIPVSQAQTGSDLNWIGADVNWDLIAYLHSYIALRPRNRANLYSLLNRARVWCKEKGISEVNTARLVPYCVAEAFKASESEIFAAQVLNGASVKKATDIVNTLQEGREGFFADCARVLYPAQEQTSSFVLA